MKKVILSILWAMLLLPGASGTQAQSNVLEEAILKTRSDIEQSTEELNSLRERLASERRPLADEVNALRTEVASLRQRAESLRRAHSRSEGEHAALRADVQSRKDETQFIQSLLREYRRASETRMGAAEAMAWREQLIPVDALLEDSEDYAVLPHLAQALLSAALERNTQRLGGYSFEGAVMNDEGLELKGRFAVLGPMGWFVASDQSVAAPVVAVPGLHLAGLDARGPVLQTERAQHLADGREAVLPVDVTEGAALRMSEARPTLIAQARQGGFVMVPLLAVAFISLLLMMARLRDFKHVLVRDPELVQQVLAIYQSEGEEAAQEYMSTTVAPLKDVLSTALRHGHRSQAHLEELLYEQVQASAPLFERYLGTLAVFGAIAPLLGLLGTVTGMIHTFQLVSVFGSGDAQLLSSGISEALVTTEFGLVIAIPVLLAHAFLTRRARALLSQLEQTTTDLIRDLTSEQE